MTGAGLGGVGVLVTRAAEQAGPLCEAIRQAGGVPLLLPALRIRALPRAEERDIEADLVIFISPNAVRFGGDILACSRCARAAIGPATAAALGDVGYPPDVTPATGYDSESLLAAPELADVAGRHVLIVRGRGGRELLAETLRERGARVSYAEVYERVLPSAEPGAVEKVMHAWRGGKIRFVVCLSVATLRNFIVLIGESGKELLRSTTLVSASARVLKLAKIEGIALDTLLAQGPEPSDLVRAMKFYDRDAGDSESDHD